MAQTPSPNNSVLPAGNAALVVNDVPLPAASRALSLAVAGALHVVMEGGQDVIIPSGALAPGLLHPLRITLLKAAGTTATGVVAYW